MTTPMNAATLACGLATVIGLAAGSPRPAAADEAGPGREGPPGLLGELLKREDLKRAHLVIGVVERGKVEYVEATLTEPRHLKRLREILGRARYIPQPASYELGDKQEFDLAFSKDPVYKCELYAPPRHLSVAREGARRDYYEIPQLELVALCKEARSRSAK